MARKWLKRRDSRFLMTCLALRTILEDDGRRNGLDGGNRDNGGASNVDNNWRDNADDNLSVRLVLSRNTRYIVISFLFLFCSMPKGEIPRILAQNIEKQAVPESGVRSASFWDARIRSEQDVEAQLKWQKEGTMVGRRVREMFDKIAMGPPLNLPLVKGEKEGVEYRKFGLPETDALIAEMIRSARDLSYTPQGEWANLVEDLRRVKTSQGEVNVLALLARGDVPASTRWDFWNKEIQGIIQYTMGRDLARLRELPPSPSPLPEGEEAKEGDVAPEEPDEMRTSMDEMSEQKEGETPQGYFSVHPFWGGYYRQVVFEKHIGGDRWSKQARTYQAAPKIEKLSEERVLRGKIKPGGIRLLPIPYGFTPDQESIKSTDQAVLMIDDQGLYAIDARGAKSAVSFTVMIGKPPLNLSLGKGEKEGVDIAVSHTFIGAEARAILDSLRGNTLEKSRAIKRFVRQTLIYSNESALNAVYTSDPNGYFAAIEKYKKADCDVANAYYINLLSAAGIKARMVTGHYVKMKNANGAAIMNSGSRHAWTEIWDDAARAWERMDATPPGDPTLDEDPPDEKSEDDSGPGDYGEQDAPHLTEEQFEDLRRKIKEAAERAKIKTPDEILNEKFAEEAGCAPQEAGRVRAKIEAARHLTDEHGRVIRDTLGQEFQKIVDTNYKDRPEWRGPVPRSEGDELDDRTMAAKDKAAGIADVMGYTRETIERVVTQEYGGMKVYMVVDRSESMNWNDPTTGASKRDEQQLASFLVLDSVFAFSYKTKVASDQDQLVSPLSVESAVVAFQSGSAEEIKPCSATWTPKEQYNVWKGLESNIGGGTPAQLGLKKVRQMIEQEIAREKEIAKRHGEAPKKWVRVVTVFMDGGVDPGGLEEFLAEQKKLEEIGVEVSIWGMTESARAVEAYPNGHCVESARKMIAPVTGFIIDKAQELKLGR